MLPVSITASHRPRNKAAQLMVLDPPPQLGAGSDIAARRCRGWISVVGPNNKDKTLIVYNVSISKSLGKIGMHGFLGNETTKPSIAIYWISGSTSI